MSEGITNIEEPGELYAGDDIRARVLRVLPDIVQMLNLQHWHIDTTFVSSLDEDHEEDSILTPAMVDYLWTYKKCVLRISLIVALPAEKWVKELVHEHVHLLLASYQGPVDYVFSRLHTKDAISFSHFWRIANEQSVENVVRVLYNTGALDSIIETFKK